MWMSSSPCPDSCSSMNKRVSLVCCPTYPDYHSECCGAQSGLVFERWEFQCRHVGTTITPLTVSAFEFWCRQEMEALRLNTSEPNFAEWLLKYPEARRPALALAREESYSWGLCRQDAKADVFLKSETSNKMTDPRNITPRADRLLTVLGPVVNAIEHLLVRTGLTMSPRRPISSGTTMLVKGLNLKQRLQVLHDQFSTCKWIIESDFTRFDRSCSLPILRDVQNFILKLCSQDHTFHTALDLTLHTSASSRFGVRYKVEGTRCSGDAHTSVGNGLINAFIIWFCLRHLPRQAWTSTHEGDDGLIGIRDGYKQSALDGLAHIPFLGFDAKQDCYNQLDDASFCGRHFYHANGQLQEHADVMRSLVKYHTTTSNCKDLALIRAKAMSYYETDSTTPLIGVLAYALLQATEGHVSFSSLKRARLADDRWSVRDLRFDFNAKRPLRQISWEARLSVARRTNITPTEQIILESAYLQMAVKKNILVMPRIPAFWNMRKDGHVYGVVSDWLRTE